MAEKVNMPSQKKEKKKKRKKKLPSDFYDYNLLACTILLVSFGLIMLYLSLIHISEPTRP